MNVIRHILHEELDRLQSLAQDYKRKIEELPKGSLSRKFRNGRAYIYLAYREKGKVLFKYIGKESSEAAKNAKLNHDKRLGYIKNLRQIEKDIKELRRIIHGRRR
jgi:hypothetical protein